MQKYAIRLVKTIDITVHRFAENKKEALELGEQLAHTWGLGADAELEVTAKLVKKPVSSDKIK